MNMILAILLAGAVVGPGPGPAEPVGTITPSRPDLSVGSAAERVRVFVVVPAARLEAANRILQQRIGDPASEFRFPIQLRGAREDAEPDYYATEFVAPRQTARFVTLMLQFGGADPQWIIRDSVKPRERRPTISRLEALNVRPGRREATVED